MCPENDDFADALSSSVVRLPSAAYRRVLDALRELNPDDHEIARRMKDTRVPSSESALGRSGLGRRRGEVLALLGGDLHRVERLMLRTGFCRPRGGALQGRRRRAGQPVRCPEE